MAADRILAEIARKGGGRLLDRAISRVLPASPAKGAKPGLLGGIAGTLALRVATRSIPGAIVVGGAMLAKHLHDRRRAGRTKPKDGQNPPAKG